MRFPLHTLGPEFQTFALRALPSFLLFGRAITATAATMGLPPWGWQEESNTTTPPKRIYLFCLAGGSWDQNREGLTESYFYLHLVCSSGFGAIKAPASLIVLLVSQSASQHLLFRVLRQMLPAYRLALLVTLVGETGMFAYFILCKT